MKDELFNTEKKREAAIATFTMGVSTPIWQLMKKILEANIKVITEQILNGSEDATKEQMDRLRDKLKVYKNIVNTPESMIKSLTPAEGEEIGLDPYYNEDQLQKETNKPKVDK